MAGTTLYARKARARSVKMTDVKIRIIVISEGIVFSCSRLIPVFVKRDSRDV
jgi:hypothetical protein